MSTENGPSAASAKPASPHVEVREPGLPTIDVNEYGGKREGVRQELNRRLFMQLLVFESPKPTDKLAAQIKKLLDADQIAAVVYADAMAPRRFALLTWSEDPAHFVTRVR